MKNPFLLLILVATTSLSAQNQGAVKGNIVDLELGGEPLMFANVSLKRSTRHTQTNFNGNFEILDVAPGNYTVEIASLGYETLKIPIEVEANSLVRIETGMRAKSISLDDASSLVISERFDNEPLDKAEKRVP